MAGWVWLIRKKRRALATPSTLVSEVVNPLSQIPLSEILLLNIFVSDVVIRLPNIPLSTFHSRAGVAGGILAFAFCVKLAETQNSSLGERLAAEPLAGESLENANQR